MKKIVFLIGFVFIQLVCFSQTSHLYLKSLEDSLLQSAWVMQASVVNEERTDASKHFGELLKKTFEYQESFIYPFDSLKFLSKLTAPDKSFRLYTWSYQTTDGNHFYYSGFIQQNPSKITSAKVFELIDSSDVIKEPASTKLNQKNWYGAFYSKIILKENGKKKFYTLLGWKGNNIQSTKKVIDCLSFVDDTPFFGSEIFPSVVRKDKKNHKRFTRVIFEYNASAVMSLKYDESAEMIVFDHLSPTTTSEQDITFSNGPDLSFDGLQFKGGKWNYFPDVDIRNLNSPTRTAKRKTKEMPVYKAK